MLGVYGCHRPTVTKSQFFSFLKSGVLRTENSCASVQKRENSLFYNVQMSPCADRENHQQKWEYTSNQQIRNIETDHCLDVHQLNNQDHVLAIACDPLRQTQKWKLD